MYYHIKWLWLLLALLLVPGCAQGIAEISPPDIRYGEDTCAECNMIISDPRFAAAYAHEISAGRYEQLAFDDIGDMLIHAAKHPEHQVAGWYVHDYESEEWLDATSAHFVASDAIVTPMGHGLAAFATAEDAQALAAENGGEVLTWEMLQARDLDASMHADSHGDSH
ncbi:MAG: nitrous oxide reductase accessory protein NosL [Caldilineaceae bacterium]|nr:nitrous oxide reductase accessory protein NosL [Caldilineaceae bacterium]